MKNKVSKMLRFVLKNQFKTTGLGRYSPNSSRHGITLGLTSLQFYGFPGVSQVPWELQQKVMGKFCYFKEQKGAVFTGEAFHWGQRVFDQQFQVVRRSGDVKIKSGTRNLLENQPVGWDGAICIFEQGHGPCSSPLGSLYLAPALLCHKEALLR